jgi:uncharacterized sodium:solute symporter family permease YidK
MTDRGNSHISLIILILSWYTLIKKVPMHIVRLLERRFPEHKRSIASSLFILSLSLLLIGIGLMFLH